MREDIQKIFMKTNLEKQVMMFSATMSEKTVAICEKFMRNVGIIRISLK